MIREFHHIDLTARNSFRVAQRAARLVEFDRADDLGRLFADGGPAEWYLLGGGNNILFTRDYEGTLLTPVGRTIERLGEEGDRVRVRARPASNAGCGGWRTSRSFPAPWAQLRYRTSGPTAPRRKTRSRRWRCSAPRPATR